MGAKYRDIKKPVKIGEKKPESRMKTSPEIQEAIRRIEKEGEKALENMPFTTDLEENYSKIDTIFKDCSDLVVRRFTIGEKQVKCFIVYIDGIVEKDRLDNFVLESLMNDARMTKIDREIKDQELVEIIKDTVAAVGASQIIKTFKDAVNQVLQANCVLFVDDNNKALSMNIEGWKSRAVSEPVTEMVVRGPMEGFVENSRTNTALLRKKLRTSDFKIEKHEVGRLSKSDVMVAYVKGIVNEGILNEVRKRIDRIDTDIMPASSYLEKFIEDEPFSPFPQVDATERPDAAVAALSEGYVIVIADGSPFALILPAVFPQFLSSSEDYYQRFYFASFIRILRYIAFAITLLFPSFYVAITTFHEEMIPTGLLVSLITTRAGIPFPAVVEALLMEFVFEILREAGVRLPRPVGQAVSIVGALVIGEAGVQAGIVSPIMVIVVAFTGICSFTIPKFSTSIAVRLLRFPMMVLAGTLGVFGIVAGIMVLLIHLSSLRSVGVPYMSPLSPVSLKDLKDTLIRAPLWTMIRRPNFLKTGNPVRMKEGLKPEPPGKG